jgi:hypothetical protein
MWQVRSRSTVRLISVGLQPAVGSGCEGSHVVKIGECYPSPADVTSKRVAQHKRNQMLEGRWMKLRVPIVHETLFVDHSIARTGARVSTLLKRHAHAVSVEA